jgi:mannose/fructose/N-acetylgalactosamine-specific phosphotransferase system component IIB
MIKLVRCDDRLIHGQCMTNVVRVNDINNIIVIDDETAQDPVLKMIFSAAVPNTIKANVYSQQEAVEVVKTAQQDKSVTLILMRHPEYYPALRKQVSGLPNRFNIGPMAQKQGAVEATNFAFLLPQEAAALKELADDNVEVYFQQTNLGPVTEWKSVSSKF